MTLHPEVQALLDDLRSLERLLARHDEFWAAHIRASADEIAHSDAHGLRRLLGLFGGMGSLNDLVLQQGGTPLLAENDELDALRTSAWEKAYALRREAS
jgi:hypothetical protein